MGGVCLQQLKEALFNAPADRRPVVVGKTDERGQMLNANMADYLVPMMAEMPDIAVAHVVSPTLESEIGAKGAGEAGTAGAAAAVANAVNDALSPFGVTITEIPLTPERVLRALGIVR